MSNPDQYSDWACDEEDEWESGFKRLGRPEVRNGGELAERSLDTRIYFDFQNFLWALADHAAKNQFSANLLDK